HSALIRTWVHAAAIFLVLAAAAPVAAQSQSKWQLEFSAGGGPSSTPHDISSGLPGAGPPFTTVVGTPSRRIPSWYLGDGALLVNQVNGALGVSQRIAPLDPVFQTAFADRHQGAMFGIRVSRTISRGYRLPDAPAARYSAAFAVDYGRGRFEVNGPAIAAIEAARASFAPALSALIATGPFTAPSVTSTSAIRQSGGQQLFATGALDIDFRTSSGAKSIPYLSVGGGVKFRVGEPPEAS